MLSVVENFDVGDPRVLDFLVADPSAGVVVLLILRRIQRSNSESQTRACGNPSCHPVKFEWQG